MSLNGISSGTVGHVLKNMQSITECVYVSTFLKIDASAPHSSFPNAIAAQTLVERHHLDRIGSSNVIAMSDFLRGKEFAERQQHDQLFLSPPRSPIGRCRNSAIGDGGRLRNAASGPVELIFSLLLLSVSIVLRLLSSARADSICYLGVYVCRYHRRGSLICPISRSCALAVCENPSVVEKGECVLVSVVGAVVSCLQRRSSPQNPSLSHSICHLL